MHLFSRLETRGNVFRICEGGKVHVPARWCLRHMKHFALKRGPLLLCFPFSPPLKDRCSTRKTYNDLMPASLQGTSLGMRMLCLILNMCNFSANTNVWGFMF